MTLFCGGRDSRRVPPPAQGGAEDSVRFLLIKNSTCSFSFPLPGTCYLVWTVRAALAVNQAPSIQKLIT